MPNTNYGNRPDGSPKGRGFLGVLKGDDGKDMSEFSVGLIINGKETNVPTMIPGLSANELIRIKTGVPITGQSDVEVSIAKKSKAHAEERINKGMSPFASEAESPKIEDIRAKYGHNNNPPIIDTLIKDTGDAVAGALRGVTVDLVGAPSDILNIAFKAIGIDAAKDPFLGNQHIRKLTGQPLEENAAGKFGNIGSMFVNPTKAVAGVGLIGAGILKAASAEDMAKASMVFKKTGSMSEVFKQTGVTRDALNRADVARVEIKDYAAKLSESAANFVKKPTNPILSDESIRFPTLDKILDHPDLFNIEGLGEALKKTKVIMRKNDLAERPGNVTGVDGVLQSNNTIILDLPRGAGPVKVMQTLLHEVQHRVQELQGLQTGANPEYFVSKINRGKLSPGEQQAVINLRESGMDNVEDIAHVLYRSVAGEVEARAVADRYGMTLEELRTIVPEYDVPYKDVIKLDPNGL